MAIVREIVRIFYQEIRELPVVGNYEDLRNPRG